MKHYDYIITGSGVIGLNLAIALKKINPSYQILVLEKEPRISLHASGRNSGVLHAGFYYSPDSLKARFTKQGNERWRDFCLEENLPMNPCGKLVVAQNPHEDAMLDVLYDRCLKFGITAELIDTKQALELEPRCKTLARALWSPYSYSVDPRMIMQRRFEQALELKIDFALGETYTSYKKCTLKTSKQSYQAKFLVNCAGAYADRIAHSQNIGHQYKILPFKGLYLKSSEKPGALKRHIYPVPDLRYPFLGVHFTLTSENEIKIGPTATPAFWREQYGGIAGFSPREFLEASYLHGKLCCFGPKQIRKLAWNELQKLLKRHLVATAANLAQGVSLDQYQKWGAPGIRAQIVDTKTNTLVMDYLTLKEENSFHVLNSISPAFTSALPFCDYLAEQVECQFLAM